MQFCPLRKCTSRSQAQDNSSSACYLCFSPGVFCGSACQAHALATAHAKKTSSWRTRACVPGPRLGHTPNGGRNHCLFKTSAAQVWPNLAQGPARDRPRALAARARPGLLPVVKHLLVHESRLGSFYCHDQGACDACCCCVSSASRAVRLPPPKGRQENRPTASTPPVY